MLTTRLPPTLRSFASCPGDETRFLIIFLSVVAVLFGLEILKLVPLAGIEPWPNNLARMSAW
jgi:hypothetical protein